MDGDVNPWELNPSGEPLTDDEIERARKSKFYERFSEMLASVPSLRLKSQAWPLFQTIHRNMDQMRTFRSNTNAVNADLAMRVAILDSGLIGLQGSGCLINRHFDAPAW